MGNSPTVEYEVGMLVDARVDGNQRAYFPAKIVKKHEYGRYDVTFIDTGKTMTVFWDDIKPDYHPTAAQQTHQSQHADTSQKHSISASSTSLLDESKLSAKLQENIDNGVYDALPTKVFNISLCSQQDDNSNGSNHEQAWNEFVQNFDVYLKQKQKVQLELETSSRSTSFDLSHLRKFEQLLLAMGGEPLCRDVILSKQEEAGEYVVNRIKSQQTMAQQNDELEHVQEIKYIDKLKNIQILPPQSAEHASNDCVFSKYGLRYEIAMDLDYDALVTESNKDRFRDEVINEIASVLSVHPSLIRVDEMRKGSVIISCGIAAIALVLIVFGAWSVYKLRYFVSKKESKQRSMSQGEKLSDVCIGDQVVVDWQQKEYDAEVVEKHEDNKGAWVKVAYIGKPFTFQNTEKIELNSPRLRLKEPGYQYEAVLCPNEGGKVSFEILPISHHFN